MRSKRLQYITDDYSFYAAVRGPDIGCSVGRTLKHFITGRVRYIAFGKGRYGLHNGDRMTKKAITEYLYQLGNTDYRSSQRQWSNLCHYRRHLSDAIAASQRHPIWGQHADALYRAMVISHIKVHIEAIRGML